MRMMFRWTGVPALMAAMLLAACAPTDEGADEESVTPTVSEEPAAEPSATPTPYAIDEY